MSVEIQSSGKDHAPCPVHPRWMTASTGELASRALVHLPLELAAVRLSSTSSSEKLPIFWLGGYSLNVAM
jgi:hypothetical protein